MIRSADVRTTELVAHCAEEGCVMQQGALMSAILVLSDLLRASSSCTASAGIHLHQSCTDISDKHWSTDNKSTRRKYLRIAAVSADGNVKQIYVHADGREIQGALDGGSRSGIWGAECQLSGSEFAEPSRNQCFF